MNKKLLIFAILVMLIVLSVATIITVAKTDLARLEVQNKTDKPVSISLTNEFTFYYLTVAAGETKFFTVERLVYDQTIWACDKSESGTVNLEVYLKLTFTQCAGNAPNQGERTMEKVHIDDTPDGINHHFQFEND